MYTLKPLTMTFKQLDDLPLELHLKTMTLEQLLLLHAQLPLMWGKTPDTRKSVHQL